jgi:hypothetical protein
MPIPYAINADDLAPLRALSGVSPENTRTNVGAVSWGAIVAGGGAISDHRAKHPTPEAAMRSPIPFCIGVPIPVIILIAVFCARA